MKKEKLTKKEYQLKWAKENLEHKKNVYKTYLEVLIEYNMPSVAYSAIKVNNMYQKELLRLMDEYRKKGKSFMRTIFGYFNHKKLTEIEKLENREKHYDKLIKSVEERISMFSFDLKMKIAKDAIEKQNAWFGLFKYQKELIKYKKNGKKR
ncbi:MAG: hypothetical protein IIA87_03535 [Nanoarchaeota archaeon]|nr:hypothetical protein [Nanoarchaeota archaeon]